MSPRSLVPLLLLLVPAALFACASDETAAPDGGDTPQSVPDGSMTDGSPDDAADARVDGGSPVDGPCAEDDWCPTQLPPKTDATEDAGAAGEPTAETVTFTGVLAKTENDAWAVSSEGLILHWDGSRWRIDTDTGENLRAITEDEHGNLWAVGARGTILRHDAGDATWQPFGFPDSTDLRAVCTGKNDARFPQNLWVMSAGQISRWTGETEEDGSPRWQTMPSGDNEFRSMWCSQGNVWLTAQGFDWNTFEDVFLLLSNDGTANDGANWNVTPSIVPSGRALKALDSLWAYDPSHVWLGTRSTEREYLLARSPSQVGDEWPAMVVGANDFSSDLSMHVWGRSNDDVWVVLLHGRIYHWDGTQLSIGRTSKDGFVFVDELNDVTGSPDGDEWAVGKNVALHHRKGQ